MDIRLTAHVRSFTELLNPLQAPVYTCPLGSGNERLVTFGTAACDSMSHIRCMSISPHTTKWHESTQRNRAIIRDAKDVPCQDCKGKFPAVCMDFDHRDQSSKVNIIAHMMTASLERLQAEIDKCDVVCANCHRIRSDAAGHAGSRPNSTK